MGYKYQLHARQEVNLRKNYNSTIQQEKNTTYDPIIINTTL